MIEVSFVFNGLIDCVCYSLNGCIVSIGQVSQSGFNGDVCYGFWFDFLQELEGCWALVAFSFYFFKLVVDVCNYFREQGSDERFGGSVICNFISFKLMFKYFVEVCFIYFVRFMFKG